MPVGALLKSYQITASAVRKARRGRTFNRDRAALELRKQVAAAWAEQDRLLLEWLEQREFGSIRSHVENNSIEKSRPIEKALSEDDKRLIAQLLIEWGGLRDAAQVADLIVKATAFATYEAAARFALGQIGVANAAFHLRNEAIKERILTRAETLSFASQRHGRDTLETIVRNFYDLGRNPYDASFLRDLKRTIKVRTEWEARRFALTETGIVAELAQIDTYRRNGVGRKQWNTKGVNTRPSHAALEGVQVAIAERFDVGGAPADHPLDPALPPDELVNCHCYLTPVVDESFEIDPRRLWEGQ